MLSKSQKNHQAPFALPQQKHSLEQTELTYADDFDEIQGNIIKANAQFIHHLEKHKHIIIQGSENDDMIFCTEDSTFKMRGINLPTTMLVIDSNTNHNKKENSSNICNQIQQPNSLLHSKHHVSHIRLQTHNYLKIEPYQVQYHRIYSQLMKYAVNDVNFKASNNIQEIIDQFGLSFFSITKNLKISIKQFLLIAKHATVILFRTEDIPTLLEETFVFPSVSIILEIFRNLLPILTENDLCDKWFSYQDICQNVKIEHQKVLMATAKMLDFQINYRQEELYDLKQNFMQNEIKQEKKFKITLKSIIKFILLQLALVKSQYLANQMDEIINKMIALYIPVGIESFQEPNIKQAVQQLVGSHFLTVPKAHLKIRIYYNPLLIDPTIKQRIKFMSNFKNKFNIYEIKGIFSCIIGKDNLDLSDLIMKNFRKQGDQYEIKLIIPK